VACLIALRLHRRLTPEQDGRVPTSADLAEPVTA